MTRSHPHIRSIDASVVSGLRSQAIYHGLGYAFRDDTPDTIALVTPGSPYMCVGHFQEPVAELDMNLCGRLGLPVIRRETGGGTVYIDEGQLFVQWIFQKRSLPVKVDNRFRLFVEPLIRTYRHFGIDAYYSPINDVLAGGKKIVGTGAGSIGNAEVVTGNIIFDFNFSLMAEAISAPPGEFREVVRRDLKMYMTTMKEELETVPSREEVIRVYLQNCSEVLGAQIINGDFTAEELVFIEEQESKLGFNEWNTDLAGTGSDKIFKIHYNAWVGQVSHHSDGLEYQAIVTMVDDTVSTIQLSCTHNHLGYDLHELEMALKGCPMDRGKILGITESIAGYAMGQEWAYCIMRVKEMQWQQTGHGSVERHN